MTLHSVFCFAYTLKLEIIHRFLNLTLKEQNVSPDLHDYTHIVSLKLLTQHYTHFSALETSSKTKTLYEFINKYGNSISDHMNSKCTCEDTSNQSGHTEIKASSPQIGFGFAF